MLETLKVDVVGILSKVQVRAESDVEAVEEKRRRQEAAPKHFEHQSPNQEQDGAVKQATRTVPKVGRNDPCPCGSGKKYKHCHGKLS